MANFYKRAILPAALTALLVAGTSEAATPVSQETFLNNLSSPYRAWQKGELKHAQQAPRKADAKEETLLEMNFSGFTEGTEEELGPHLTEGYITEGNPYIDPKYMNGQEGWWGIGVYSAGGACALARPGFGGSIAIPMMNLYGNLHISCRVKVREGNKGSVILFFTLASNDIWSPANPLPPELTPYKVFKAEDSEKGWMDVTVDIPCNYNFDDAFIQFNSVCYSKTGLLIDDIKITRDFNFVSPVTNIWFEDFTRDGFTARWQPGAENKSFLVSLIEETVLAEEEKEYFEDFENPESAGKWASSGAEVAAGKGANGTAGLLLKGEASIEFPINYANFNDLILWLSTSGISKESEAGLKISVLDEDGWGSLGTIQLKNVDPAGMELKFTEAIKNFSGQYMGIRLSTEDFAEGETVVLDNLKWTTQGAYSRADILKAEPVKENFLTLTDIDFDKRYYMQVAGVNGELVSKYTSLHEVRGVAAPTLLPASDINPEAHSYTARWESAPLADSYTVSSYAVRTLKAEKECEVFFDTFDNAKADEEGKMMWLDQVSFDGIANHNGWKCLTGDSYMDESKIGGSVIASPEMSLHNNNGKFTVSFTAYSCSGTANIIVQSGNQTRVARLDCGYDVMTGTYNEGTKEVKVEFDNGTPHTQLLFYTTAGNSIMLANVSVTQDINDGDKYYELLEEQTVQAPLTELALKNLPASDNNLYAFNVTSNRKYADEQLYSSNKKENMEVKLVSSVEELQGAAEITVRTAGNAIEILLPAAERVNICNAAGMEVAAFTGAAGVNTVTDLAKGAYIVRTGDKVSKVIL